MAAGEGAQALEARLRVLEPMVCLRNECAPELRSDGEADQDERGMPQCRRPGVGPAHWRASPEILAEDVLSFSRARSSSKGAWSAAPAAIASLMARSMLFA